MVDIVDDDDGQCGGEKSASAIGMTIDLMDDDTDGDDHDEIEIVERPTSKRSPNVAPSPFSQLSSASPSDFIGGSRRCRRQNQQQQQNSGGSGSGDSVSSGPSVIRQRSGGQSVNDTICDLVRSPSGTRNVVIDDDDVEILEQPPHPPPAVSSKESPALANKVRKNHKGKEIDNKKRKGLNRGEEDGMEVIESLPAKTRTPRTQLKRPSSSMSDHSDHQQHNSTVINVDSNKKKSLGENGFDRSAVSKAKVNKGWNATTRTTPKQSVENHQTITNNNGNYSPKKTVNTERIANISTTPNGSKITNSINYNRLRTSSVKKRKKNQGLPISSPESRRSVFASGSNDAATKSMTVTNDIRHKPHPIDKGDTRNSNDATVSFETRNTHDIHHEANPQRTEIGGGFQNNQNKTNVNAIAVKCPNPKSGKRKRCPSSPLFLLNNGHIPGGAKRMSKSKRRRMKAKSKRLKEKRAKEEKYAEEAVAKTSPTKPLPIAAAAADTTIPVAANPAADIAASRANSCASTSAIPALKSSSLSPSNTKSTTIFSACKQSEKRGEMAKTPTKTISLSLLSLKSPLLPESINRRKEELVQDEKRIDNLPSVGNAAAATRNLATIPAASESVVTTNDGKKKKKRKKKPEQITSEESTLTGQTANPSGSNTTGEMNQPSNSSSSSSLISPSKTMEGKSTMASSSSTLTTTSSRQGTSGGVNVANVDSEPRCNGGGNEVGLGDDAAESISPNLSHFPQNREKAIWDPKLKWLPPKPASTISTVGRGQTTRIEKNIECRTQSSDESENNKINIDTNIGDMNKEIEDLDMVSTGVREDRTLGVDGKCDDLFYGEGDVADSAKRQTQVNTQKPLIIDNPGNKIHAPSMKSHVGKDAFIETTQIVSKKRAHDAGIPAKTYTKSVIPTGVEKFVDERKGYVVGDDSVVCENSSNMSSDVGKIVIEIPDEAIEIPDDDNFVRDTLLEAAEVGLRMSRDRQYAIHLNRKWRKDHGNREHQGTPRRYNSIGNDILPLESNIPPPDFLEAPKREGIELLGDSDCGSEVGRNDDDKIHPAMPQTSSTGAVEQGKISFDERLSVDGNILGPASTRRRGTDSIVPNLANLTNHGMSEEEQTPIAVDANTKDQQGAGGIKRKHDESYRKDTGAGTSSTSNDTVIASNCDERADGGGVTLRPALVDDSLSSNKMTTGLKSKIMQETSNSKTRSSLSTQSSTDDDSMSSLWTDSFHDSYEIRHRSSTAKLRGSRNVIISASDNNSNSGFESQSTAATATKNHQCDFTGKEISSGNSNRRSGIQHRASGRILIDSDDHETDYSSNRQSGEISPLNSSDTPVIKTKHVLQRKAPPPLENLETAKENIMKISRRIHLQHKKAKMNILEKALSQRNAYNRQLAPTRTFSPRIQVASTKLEYMERNESQSMSGDGHTAIVNSSLAVLSTVNDDNVKEDTEQMNVHKKAQNLGVMPYKFKILQKEFTSILDALPFDQRYDPEVHEYVSQLLYTPPDNSKPRLEVPPELEEAPTYDIPPPEATPKLKDPDENNQDYVSVMKSFRDFCVQCKTFDCQFHITSYPDAGTQACVAIQYDKRALKKQSGEQFKLNRDDPFSFLVPTTENRMVLVDERKFDRFENPTSVDVIGSTKSTTKWIEKSTFTFSSDNMICPFCNFCCHGKEKLLKHMSRYHVDTFYCREVGTRSNITANVRTGANETMKPVREYFHSRSLIPIEIGHYDRDSDDESVYSWYHDYRRDLMEDLTDVCEKEKRISIIWNRFLGCSPVVIADKDVPKRCFYFIQKYFMDLGQLEWELYQLLITFWERHLLTVIHVEKLMHLFHVKRETQYSKQEENPLTPRKKVLFSRLYMIFESLGENMESRLRDALRRNDVGNSDVVCTPMLPKPLWTKWTTKRTINTAMRMRAEDISRPFFFPCFHAGKCDEANDCTCVENDCLCTKHCVWGVFGDNFFPGCSCKGDCTISKMCPCRDAHRECDPDVCRCNASTNGCRKTCGCANMDVSLAKRAPLLIGRSLVEGAGLGLFTKNALKQGNYVDEVRSNTDAWVCPFLCSFRILIFWFRSCDSRVLNFFNSLKQYIGEFIKREYQLGRSEEYYFDNSDDYITDATHQGNKTRYLNHSLSPNIEARHRFVNGEKRIAFYAKQDILAQAEVRD